MRVKIGKLIVFLVATTIVAVLLLSCETAPDEPEIPDDETTVGVLLGGVSGFAYMTTMPTIIDRPENATPGATPLAGAEVTLTMVTDTDQRQATTGGDGGFSVAGLQPGLYSVELRANSASTAPDFESTVSVIANHTIPLGKSYQVTRSAALDALLGNGSTASRTVQDLSNALILGMTQPMPVGVDVRAVSPEAGNSPIYETTANEWFFFVDLHPVARFSHDVEYVFVNADNGTVQRFAANSLPIVNGVAQWYSDRTYVVYTGDEFSNDPTGEFTMTPTDEVVQIPAIASPALGSGVNRGSGPNATLLSDLAVSPNPEDWFSMNLVLDSRLDFLRDFRIMFSFFQESIPFVNQRDLLSWRWTAAEFDQEYKKLYDALSDKIDARVAQKGKPTLFVYINGHANARHFYGDPTGFAKVLLEDGASTAKKASYWKLEDIGACKVVVIWETCYAEFMAGELSKRFEAKLSEDRPELRVFASSAADEWSQATPWFFGLTETGGQFTKRFVEHASIVDGDIAGVTDGSGSLIPELKEWFSGPMEFDQHAKLVELFGFPFWCEELQSFMTVDKPNISLQVPVPVSSPCNKHIDDLVITNTTRLDVHVTVTSSDPSIKPTVREFDLSPEAWRTVAVFYDCSTPPPVDATVTFFATSASGYTHELEVAVAVRAPLSTASRDFAVRAPGPGGTNNYGVSFLFAAGTVVDHTTLIDKATGGIPPLQPWLAEGSGAGFKVEFEGWDDSVPPRWVYEFKITDPLGQGCAACLPKEWTYTVYFTPGQ